MQCHVWRSRQPLNQHILGSPLTEKLQWKVKVKRELAAIVNICVAKDHCDSHDNHYHWYCGWSNSTETNLIIQNIIMANIISYNKIS